MQVCRTCGKAWPDNHIVCPHDGARLSSPAFAATGSAAPELAPLPSYDDELAPGSTAGEYRIEKKIGEGGMGAVYGAKHPLIGKRAAIKVIRRQLSSNPEAVDRFVREAQAVNTIGHPNIVDVFSFGQLPDGRCFFVMEWLQGESLRQRLERPLTYVEAIDIIDTIAKALIAAHEAGVVHRDLKPDNVFLSAVKDEKPVVMLLDFGLAKLTSDEGRIEQTRSGVVMGTPLYISPEQAKGVRVDAGTDIYALGAMAYEMFSGRVPFLADSAVEIMSLHITQPPLPPTVIAPALPPEVDALVLAMMAKDPGGRPTLPQVRKQLAGLRGLTASGSPVGSAVAPGFWPEATPLPTQPEMSPMRIAGASPASSPGTLSGRRLTGVLVAAGAAGAVVVAVVVFMVMRAAGSTSAPPAPPPEPRAAVELATPEPVTPVAVAPVAPAPVPPVTPEAEIPTPPPPPAKRPAKIGTVRVTIAGAQRAKVFVDGRLVAKGTAQITLPLAPGTHTIRAESAKHKPAEATVKITADGRSTVRLQLKKIGGVNAAEDPFAP